MFMENGASNIYDLGIFITSLSNQTIDVILKAPTSDGQYTFTIDYTVEALQVCMILE